MKSDIESVAIYARVSTRDKGQDVENQLPELRRYCRKMGWKVLAEYADQQSGATAKRPGFERMMEDARLRKFDLLLFWSLDRLTREGALATLKHLQKLTDYGVRWLSLKEEYLNTLGQFADAVISILATIARQEKQRISERTKTGLKRARRAGKTLGRPPRVVDRSRIQELRKQGLSLRQIGRKLDVSPVTVFRRLAANG
jgi:DNA invertase Pin-like site-specific DNA recombinase